MATRSFVPEAVRIHECRVKRYVHIWTIAGWSAYLSAKERSPLEERLWTGAGAVAWKLKLACHLGAVRKPEPPRLRLLAVLEREPATEVTAEGSCSLLDLKSKEAANPPRQPLAQHGKSKAILMDFPAEDVLAAQKLDEVKIRIELVIMEPLRGGAPGEPLTTEELTSLPKGAFDRSGADTAVVVDGKVIPAHQAVLADISPVFASQLRVGSWKKLELADLDFKTAKELVSFAYTKKEPNFDAMTASSVSDLLKAAETYKLEKLKKHAVDHIASKLDPANAIDVLLLAEKSDYSSLKTRVLLFIKNNKQLFSKVHFRRLSNRPDLLTEILDAICS